MILEKEVWWNPKKPWQYTVGLLSLMGLIGGGAWYVYEGKSFVPAQDSYPTIRADPGPVRLLSDNYDKPFTRHQEKLLYEKLDPTGALEKIIKIMPPEEKPLDLQTILGLSDQVTLGVVHEPPCSKETTSDTQQDHSIKVTPNIFQTQTDLFKKKYWIQLGVKSSQKEANILWQTLKKKHKNLLYRYHPQIVRIHTAKQKAQYELRLGYFMEMKTTDTLCQKLQLQGTHCIVVLGK